MKQKFSLFFLILLQAFVLEAQDLHFTQKFSNPMFINPAMAGIQGKAATGLQHRNQWEGVYHTSNLFYSQHLDLLHGGVGVQLKSDIADALDGQSETSISAVYAPDFKLSEEVDMRFGLEGGIVRRRIFYERLIFGDEFDSIPGPQRLGEDTRIYPDISTGFVLSTKRLYGGAAVFHLNRPRVSFTDATVRSSMKWTVHGGAFIPLTDDEKGWLLAPYAVYELRGVANMLIPGLSVSKGVFTGGVSRRFSYGHSNMNVFNAMAGIYLKKFKVGYSFDYDRSSRDTRTSHELALIVLLGKEKETHPAQAAFFRRMF